MISLSEIEKYYPANLKAFKRNLLHEYLQYKILQIIFDSQYAARLSFLGGTELRIVHGNSRFSEDLDFDNFKLSKKEFEGISGLVKKQLELEGYIAETRNVFKGAFRCYVRIPRLLFSSGLSGYEEEKILIQLDTMPHGFFYQPEKVILKKFDVFTEINATPADIILSQKIYAIFNRKTLKGRDFYDIIFLFSITKPNYGYLKMKMGVSGGESLKKKLLDFCGKIDLGKLAEDVRPFLFVPKDSEKIKMFEKYIRRIEM